MKNINFLHLRKIQFIVALLFFSCEKKQEEKCYFDTATKREIINKEANIISINGNYYIVEKNTIDTQLLPCNLEQDFQINNLRILVSGNVKSIVPSQICCTENFVITSIKKL